MFFNETFIIIIIIIIVIKAVCQVLKTPALRKTDEAVITECYHFIHLSEAEWTINISSLAPLPHWDHISYVGNRAQYGFIELDMSTSLDQQLTSGNRTRYVDNYSLSQNGWDTLGSPCPLNVGVQDLVTELR